MKTQMSYVNNYAKRVVFNLEAEHEEEKSQLQGKIDRKSEIIAVTMKERNLILTALALAVVLLFAGWYGWYKYPLGMYSEFSLTK